MVRRKLTPDRLRDIDRLEVIWKDAAGRTWVTSRVRAPDGTVGPIVTVLL